MSSRVQDLEVALSAALNMLSVYEHGDSRCVSDAYVALCAVWGNQTNDACLEILHNIIETDYSEQRKEYRESVDRQVVVTYDPE
ncbi:MAG: hypothetical protein P4L79_09890 [Legionella sp.]|uniref:hypothetical protein n=1 Tax=Legionella sp. TaxID=459 RepID=UPI00284255F6|nr:hypothetical protein [Legionella sp.]